jgi:hypothetical protein
MMAKLIATLLFGLKVEAVNSALAVNWMSVMNSASMVNGR